MNPRSLSAWLSCCLLVAGWITSHADEPKELPPEVAVARPLVKELTDHEDFTGRTDACERVELRARVTGYLDKVHFRDGSQVRKGDVLFEIDPRPYQAQLDQAKTQIALAQAQLSLAEKTLARYEALFKKAPGSVSEQELDQARGAVVEAKARVQAQEASLEICKVNLGFTKITSPINGRIGRQLVTPGNLVVADKTLLAVVVSVDPMYVYFDIDERTFLRSRKLLDETQRKAEKLPLAIGLGDEDTFPHQSVVDFIDNSVDARTGTLRIRAVLPNKDGRVLPGMFVRGRLAIGEPYKALLIPAQAVLSEEGQKFVLVVNDKNVVEKRPVVLGREDHGRRVVTKGLKPEDRVVVQGLHRVRPGTEVRPRPAKDEGGRMKDESRQRAERSSSSSFILHPSSFRVEAVYPGASAEVVSETVRAPIEQQIGGLEKLRLLRSRCSSDGKYVADLSFGRRDDLSIMQVLVQNRVALALPVIPAAVQEAGITVRRGGSSVLMIVNLSSPDGRYDQLYLSNYATIQIKDELSRVAGVSSTTLIGQRDYGLRLWLDPNKLAACNLTAEDVVKALREQNVRVAAGRVGQLPVPRGQAFQFTLETVGRLTEPDEFGGVILKTSRDSRVVRLRDVARIELAADTSASLTELDGKPVVTLVVALTGEVAVRKVRAALRDKLAEITERLPNGLVLDISFDFTANLTNPTREQEAAPEYLLLDVDLPDAVSLDRTEKILRRATELLRKTPGVQHVLALSENPFDLFGSGGCLLVQLSASEQRKTTREAVIQDSRKRLDELAEMRVRVRDLSAPGGFPRCGYPIDFALRGPELDRVREWSTKLGERLERNKKLSDVWVSRASEPRPQQVVEVDRQRAASLGVAEKDVLSTLQVFVGAQNVGEFNRFGRTWQVQVQAEGGSRGWAKDFRKLQVRSRDGQMVPLGALASVREIAAPLALDFLDGSPMLEITANPGAGGKVEEARKLCESLAAEIRKELGLSAEYRLTWLRDIVEAK